MLMGSLISPGDGIFVDDPIYPGTKAILRPLHANIIGVDTDANGMDTDNLERQIIQAKKSMPIKGLDQKVNIFRIKYLKYLLLNILFRTKVHIKNVDYL